ncbi:putative Fibroblast growth factor receptor 2 [Hypsibius exemplaris]|uniref:Fibroblast growth factor receptor 2 n=1 Tax=Hypsibius exemplaris TaxID=2072580 RepID=A0A1W0WXU6_HYPEX|nr:putative Fibroblast growth factor receptor 2 [Hypsibius exemplaris]
MAYSFLIALPISICLIAGVKAQAFGSVPHGNCKNSQVNSRFFHVQCPDMKKAVYMIPKNFDLSSIHPRVYSLEITRGYVGAEDLYAIPPRSSLLNVTLFNFNTEDLDPRFSIMSFFYDVKPHLKILFLSNVKILYLERDEFQSFFKLEEITMQKVFISAIAPDIFEDLSMVTMVNIGTNYLHSIDWSFLKPVSGNLKTLRLTSSIRSNSNWTCSDPKFELGVLTTADLSENIITFLPDCVMNTFRSTTTFLFLHLYSGNNPYCRDSRDCGCCDLSSLAKWVRDSAHRKISSINCGNPPIKYENGAYPGQLNYEMCNEMEVSSTTASVPVTEADIPTTDPVTHLSQGPDYMITTPTSTSAAVSSRPVTSRSTTHRSLSTFVSTVVGDKSTSTRADSNGTPSATVLSAIASSVAAVTVLIGVAALVAFRRRLLARSNAARNMHAHSWPSKVPLFIQSDLLEPKTAALFAKYTRLLDVAPSQIRISGEVLGGGAFGTVYKAIVSKLQTTVKREVTVAAKTYLDPGDQEQARLFAEEIKVMMKCGRHINIVNILGIVSKGQPFLIMEYCQYGSLLSYLRSRLDGGIYSHVDEDGTALEFDQAAMERLWFAYQVNNDIPSDHTAMKQFILSTNDLLQFCHQIARGMLYLTTRHIIHRDLAARNVLVSENCILKIADFGLARHEEVLYTVSNVFTALPVLWMSPESITTRVFSQLTDVWSYGVLVWEIYSMGNAPFAGLDVAKLSAHGFAEWLLEGHQMNRPVHATLRM